MLSENREETNAYIPDPFCLANSTKAQENGLDCKIFYEYLLLVFMNILILISSFTVLCLEEVLVSTLGMREGL